LVIAGKPETVEMKGISGFDKTLGHSLCRRREPTDTVRGRKNDRIWEPRLLRKPFSGNIGCVAGQQGDLMSPQGQKSAPIKDAPNHATVGEPDNWDEVCDDERSHRIAILASDVEGAMIRLVVR
jgi:hypothetical protein